MTAMQQQSMSDRARWIWVLIFALAMAWMEAAVVFYLRTLVDRIEPYQPRPLPVADNLGVVELIREAATMVMLLSVGWLAGKTWRSRLGYVLVAFGAWDIFYYVFLKPMCGWPRSLFDWDVLFLIPLPWWGPVISPVSIALLMVLGGTALSQFDSTAEPLWPDRRAVVLNVLGVFLALYVFMSDALRAAPQGEEAVRNALPTRFNWPLFLVAWMAMAAPVVDLYRQLWLRRTVLRAQPQRISS
jgi:hypothetical protein